jgi:signal transduction histidine kinase
MATVALAAALFALPVVGVFQYFWLDEAREGEAARLRREMENAVRQVWTDLAVELAGIFSLLPPDGFFGMRDSAGRAPEDALTDPGLTASYVTEWVDRSAYPGMLSGLYLIERTDGEETVLQYDQTDEVFEIPGDLSEVTPALGAPSDHLWFDSTEQAGIVISFPAGRPIDPDAPETEPDTEDSSSLVIVLDRDYVAVEVLASLLDTYLGDLDSFNWAVVDESTEEILSSTVDIEYDYVADTVHFTPDQVVPVTAYSAAGARFAQGLDPSAGSLPGETFQRMLSLRNLVGQQNRAAPIVELVPPGDSRSGLYVYIWHTAGSIERATTLEMRRNLLLSYLVLVLLAGVVLGFYSLLRRALHLRDREHEFVATVTHELRTPIAAMHAVADNLADGIVTKPGQVREYGHALLDEGRRLRSLVDRVLLYAGLHGAHFSRPTDRLDLSSLVAETCERVESIANLTVHIQPGIPTIVADRVAIEAVILNLLTNAVKHNDPGTPITMSVSIERGTGTILVVTVGDHGIGIPRDEIRRVTEPFVRGAASRDRQVPGTGLGLSLVRRIADTYRGTLRIHSVAGHGTTVTVRIPVVICDGDDR